MVASVGWVICSGVCRFLNLSEDDHGEKETSSGTQEVPVQEGREEEGIEKAQVGQPFQESGMASNKTAGNFMAFPKSTEEGIHDRFARVSTLKKGKKGAKKSAKKATAKKAAKKVAKKPAKKARKR